MHAAWTLLLSMTRAILTLNELTNTAQSDIMYSPRNFIFFCTKAVFLSHGKNAGSYNYAWLWYVYSNMKLRGSNRAMYFSVRGFGCALFIFLKERQT